MTTPSTPKPATPKPDHTPEQGLAARRAALETLAAILDQGRTLDEAMARTSANFDTNDLEVRDRAFARTLVATTLRRLIEIDGLIDACLDRPLPKATKTIRAILRLSITQLFFLEMPAHAVLDTANRLATHDRHPQVRRLKPLVNGVLRRLTREKPQPLAPPYRR